MPTSITPAAFQTPSRIIRYAMEDAGLLQEGDEPNSEQLTKGMQRLQDIINLWQTQGLKLFCLQDITLTPIVGQATYTMKPSGDISMTKPMRVIQGYFKDSNNVQRPLIPLSWEEYLRLSNVANSGAIINYFVDKQPTVLNIKLWNVPDATAVTGTVHLLTQVQIPYLVSVSDTLAFPPEWCLALRWGLADELATGQPQAIMDRCTARAASFKLALEDWDVEDAFTRFTPDNRTGIGYSSFS